MSMDRGAWQATIHEVAKNQIQLSTQCSDTQVTLRLLVHINTEKHFTRMSYPPQGAYTTQTTHRNSPAFQRLNFLLPWTPATKQKKFSNRLTLVYRKSKSELVKRKSPPAEGRKQVCLMSRTMICITQLYWIYTSNVVMFTGYCLH